jgi:large subunit GTPase 1
MVLAKSKKSVGLGNSLMNDRFGKGKGADMRRGAFQQGIERTGQNGEKVCRQRMIEQAMLTLYSTLSTRRKRHHG